MNHYLTVEVVGTVVCKTVMMLIQQGQAASHDWRDTLGRSILLNLDYRTVASIAIVVTLLYIVTSWRRTKILGAPINGLLHVAIGVVTLFSSVTLLCVFLLTKPPALDALSGEMLALSGLASVIATGWIGISELWSKFAPPAAPTDATGPVSPADEENTGAGSESTQWRLAAMKAIEGSLVDYGAETFERDNYICQYCGWDGRTFENWVFLTVDHVIPTSQGGSKSDSSNLVTACHMCNVLNNKTKIENFQQKKALILVRRKEYRESWEAKVKPKVRPDKTGP